MRSERMTSTQAYPQSLFIFRRDLRLEDNTALNEALERSERVSCVFILDPRQADPERNAYFSANAFAFMVESLIDLDDALKARDARLAIYEGLSHEVVGQLIETHAIDAVFVNSDVTPFSKERDIALERSCRERGCAFHASDDTTLTPVHAILTNGKPYRVFTPYWKAASRTEIRQPRTVRGAFSTLDAKRPDAITTPPGSSQRTIRGGRSVALRTLERIEGYADYRDVRDLPGEQGTTQLSAHLKFGTISARELLWKIRRTLGEDHALERQLFWRDFYHQLLYHHPEVLGREFDPVYAAGIEWNAQGTTLDAWKAGRTGFPIVDAGMRELLETGWMHNRVRMICASFLTKDLHIDWREGERYFASMLVDYDVANNNGGWQWAASTGADAAPYFRIFNPWIQQKRFDPDAVYVQRWVAELRGLTAQAIHALDSKRPQGLNYPKPIVDHAIARNEALRRYAHAREAGEKHKR